MDLFLNVPELMETRGILHKMLLDSREFRTAEEIGKLVDFLDWLHAFQIAAGDGETTVQVHLG